MTWSFLLLLVAAFIIAESQAFEKFGCTYYKEDMSDYQWSNDSVFKAKYSEEKIEPMKFNSITQFNDKLREIRATCLDVLDENLYDDLSDFLQFFYARKKYANVSFEDFYRNTITYSFKEKKSLKTSLSMSYTILNRLDKKYGMGRHCHLVTSATFGINGKADDMLKELKSGNQNFNDPPGEKSLFTHNHVAAVIHVEIEGNRSVVLLDIARMANGRTEGPIVLMEQGIHWKYLHGTDPNITRVGQYIVKDRKFNWIRDRYYGQTISSFYYIGKPYCSALISTIKRQLLMNSVRILEYDRKYLRFDLFQSSLRTYCIPSGTLVKVEDLGVIRSTTRRIIQKVIGLITLEFCNGHRITYDGTFTKNMYCNCNSCQYNYWAKNSKDVIDIKRVRIQSETVANDEEFAKEFNKWKEYMEKVSNGTQENVYEF